MEDSFLKYNYFKNINLNDPFFDSLKQDYEEFEDWFRSKGNKKAYYYENNEGIQAFLYLKIEAEELKDTDPQFPFEKRIKIGTLKINPHGTKLGERFIKKAIDHAVDNDIKELYVTVFPKHKSLIALLEKYGFTIKGKKKTKNGIENMMFKRFDELTGDIVKDYPVVKTSNNKIYLLGIYPQYHTKMFPDSILDNESYDLVKDVSHTNSIQKIYICFMKRAASIKKGDIIVIYRTKDEKGPAEYRSVATSVCVVEDKKLKSDFNDFESYYSYCKKHSVFSDEELHKMYAKENLVVLKMTYNLAMEKRLIRKTLIEDCGLDRDEYWGIMSIEDYQFNNIVKLGGINESFIVNQA
ncbi:GNAT family N-acetyltransferase [Ornithinibacillus bavariensis]|uniref:N-acetyltransferase domain-containing protein n=1 Tax=Ornithinibacillus bavariensis TaxID=545502 RepID=A0A919XCT7_9BACI|nr:N-acetyltransferase [Ornithinibacillus bavariensis]GIO28295.1 hypothetical protein J43TS3_29060 [Ornithinibacillus bavariensis]